MSRRTVGHKWLFYSFQCTECSFYDRAISLQNFANLTSDNDSDTPKTTKFVYMLQISIFYKFCNCSYCKTIRDPKNLKTDTQFVSPMVKSEARYNKIRLATRGNWFCLARKNIFTLKYHARFSVLLRPCASLVFSCAQHWNTVCSSSTSNNPAQTPDFWCPSLKMVVLCFCQMINSASDASKRSMVLRQSRTWL